jgi:hypothetical protein
MAGIGVTKRVKINFNEHELKALIAWTESLKKDSNVEILRKLNEKAKRAKKSLRCQ